MHICQSDIALSSDRAADSQTFSVGPANMVAFRLWNVILTSKVPISPYPEAITALLGLIVLSEALSFYSGAVVFKLVASLSLFGASVHAASSKFDFLSLHALLARENRFDVFLMLGLALSYMADVILVGCNFQRPNPKSPDALARLNIAKLSHSFTHIAYSLAFTSVGLWSKEHFRRADFVMAIVFGWLFVDWLGLLQKERKYDSWFEVPQKMQWPVVMYSSTTFLMVATATASDTGFQRILGAWLFMFSDLFVALKAFGVEQKQKNRISGGSEKRFPEWVTTSLGCICYYAAQLLLVGCI